MIRRFEKKRILRHLLWDALILSLGLVAFARTDLFLRRNDNYADKLVVINEVCTRNVTGIRDDSGRAKDWVELYAPGEEPVDLTGWTMSNDAGEPEKWKFPDGLQCSNYLLLFADGLDTTDGYGYPHTSFKLNSDSTTLFLYRPDGTLADSLKVPAAPLDLSYGRPLGSSNVAGWFYSVTPGVTNPAACTAVKEYKALGSAVFSTPSGFYEGAQTLALTCDDPDALIFYTTDGSDPREQGRLYTAPLTIQSRAGQDNRYATEPTTLFMSDVTTYTIAGYALKYAPDPVDKATTVKACLYKDGHFGDNVTVGTYWIDVSAHTLPVVSLTGAPQEIFGPSGIYVPGYAYYTLSRTSTSILPYSNAYGDRAVPGTVEIFEQDGTPLLQDAVQFSVAGSWSRISSQQKSLSVRLEQDELDLADYGQSLPLSRFILRSNGGGANFPALHQDAFFCNYLGGFSLDTLYNVPVILYFEDEYWGVYTVRERKNSAYYANHFGIDKTTLQTVAYGDESAVFEETKQLIDSLDCSGDDLTAAEQAFDLDNFIRYMIAQMYLTNYDGLYMNNNNSILWRATAPQDAALADGRWRFLLNDLDKTVYEVAADPFAYLLEGDYGSSEFVSILFARLWQSETFRTRFAETLREEMATTYAPEQIVPAFDAWCDLLRPEIARDLARQKVGYTPLLPLAVAVNERNFPAFENTADDWENNVQWFRDWLSHRAEYMLDYLDMYLPATNS